MKFVTRLSASMGAALLLMVLFYWMVVVQEIGPVLIFLIVYFPIIFFWDGIFTYASSFVERLAYLCVFLFWTTVFYVIIWAWKIDKRKW